MNVNDLKIPDVFNKVISKMNPEVCYIEIIDVINHAYNLYSDPIGRYSLEEKYLVSLVVAFNRGMSPKGDCEHYAQIINTAFEYTFPDEIGLVKFRVRNFNIPTPPSSKDRFLNIFQK